MLRRIIGIINYLDWISPLLAFYHNARNGPAHLFVVPPGGNWCGLAIERLLKQHGIGVWGMMFDADELLFWVRARQARWAEYVLDRAGVPILNPTLPRGVGPSSGQASHSSRSPRDWLDDIADRLGI